MLPGYDDVNLRAAGAEDVPGLLHGHAPQTRPVNVDDLVTDQKAAVPEKKDDEEFRKTESWSMMKLNRYRDEKSVSFSVIYLFGQGWDLWHH